ncbi:MAG: DUF2807 domain-containing protein [Bacteroidetes bacterium]|nr:DUF2807 domain-containing protein [Bacteroidota bacterium]MDA1336384.1 DUF2807 domain-containing protein [Bacteroidota bacterium]
MNSSKSMVRVCVVFAAVTLFSACDKLENDCFERAGEKVESVSSFDGQSLSGLRVSGNLDFTFEPWDSSAVVITFVGPENFLDNTTIHWEEEWLELNYEEYCRGFKNLSQRVQLTVQAPTTPKIELHGQGETLISIHDSTSVLDVDAYAYAGRMRLAAQGDSMRLRLHAGVCLAELSGEVNVLEMYSSGLSGIDASGLQAQASYVNQSGIQPLYFQSSEYAYVTIVTAGDVFGGVQQPEEFVFERRGSGQLFWE